MSDSRLGSWLLYFENQQLNSKGNVSGSEIHKSHFEFHSMLVANLLFNVHLQYVLKRKWVKCFNVLE